jgi:tetratricopeptide (TPR) repeat protein
VVTPEERGNNRAGPSKGGGNITPSGKETLDSAVPPLRILVVSGTTDGHPELRINEEVASLCKAVRGVQNVALDVLVNPTLAQLGGALGRARRDQFNILHYLGHGRCSAAGSGGTLSFVGEYTRVHAVQSSRIASVVRDSGLQLLVLNASEGLGSRSTDGFNRLAEDLARVVPSVVVMPFGDSSTAAFSEALYSGVAHGLPINEATFRAVAKVTPSGVPILFRQHGGLRASPAAEREPTESTRADERANLEKLLADEVTRIEEPRLAQETARFEARRLDDEAAEPIEARRLALEEAAQIQTQRLADRKARLDDDEAARIEARRLGNEMAARMETQRLADEAQAPAGEAEHIEAKRMTAAETVQLEAQQSASEMKQTQALRELQKSYQESRPKKRPETVKQSDVPAMQRRTFGTAFFQSVKGSDQWRMLGRDYKIFIRVLLSSLCCVAVACWLADNPKVLTWPYLADRQSSSLAPLEPKPADAYAFFTHGVAHEKRGDLEWAVDDYTHAIRLKPAFALAYKNRALAYEAIAIQYDDRAGYDRAIADLSSAIQLKPDYTLAYNKRAGAYSNRARFRNNKHDYALAVADYTRAIALAPQYAEAYAGRGAVYDNRAEYARSIADFTHAVQLSPTDVDAYHNRGDAYASEGNYDRAIADFTAAIHIKPDDERVYDSRGNAYDGKREYAHAIADYINALAINPDDVEASSDLERMRIHETPSPIVGSAHHPAGSPIATSQVAVAVFVKTIVAKVTAWAAP